MFIVGNLIIAVATILKIIVTVVYWLLLIRVVLSWIPIDRNHQLVLLLYNLTDPLLEFTYALVPGLRRRLTLSGMDFTPIALFIALYFFEIFLIESLLDLGQKLAG